MFVEYTIEARLDIPWWVDPVVIQEVPVLTPRRVLGVAPPLRVPEDPQRPSIRLDVDVPILTAGTVVGGYFQISNPSGKNLKSITVWLGRRVDFSAQGIGRTTDGPRFDCPIPLGIKDTVHAGRFAITVPNGADVTEPSQGSLHRCYWVLGARLDVGLGFDVDVAEAVLPAPAPPPGAATPSDDDFMPSLGPS